MVYDRDGIRVENGLEYLCEDFLKDHGGLALCHDGLCLYRDGLFHDGLCHGGLCGEACAGCDGERLLLELVECASQIEPFLLMVVWSIRPRIEKKSEEYRD